MSDVVVMVDSGRNIPIVVDGSPGVPGPTGPAGDVARVATRTAMAAIAGATSGLARFLSESGREGLFQFSTVAGDATLATADTAGGIYVAGAGGTWVRKFDGPVYVNWFGTVGDNVANDGPIFVAAIALLKAMAANDDGAYKGSVPLLIKPGSYYLGTSTLDITHQLRIEADGGTANAGKSVILRWAANTTGIRIQYITTSGSGTVDGVPHYSGASTHLKGLQMVGGYTNFASEGEYHGIHAKAAVLVEDCFIKNFQGDGLFSRASVGSGAPSEGNANVLSVRNLRVDNCRNGVYLDGADTNAGLFVALNLNSNRQWGVWDSSFLGNTYVGCHAAGNGQSASGMTPTQVSYSGYRYSPVFGQEAGAATNAPSGTATDNAYWYYYALGGADASRSIPTWVNPTTVRSGGSYMMEQAANVMIGCYGEADQGNTQLQTGSICIGGIQGTGVHGFGSFIRSALNYTQIDKLYVTFDSTYAGQMTVQNLAQFTGPTLYNGKIASNDGSRALIIDGQQYISLTIGSGFVGNILAAGIDLASGKTISINSQQVVGARGAAVEDAAALTSVNATNAVAAPTKAEFDAFVAEFNKLRTDLGATRTQLNTALARLRAATGHGLIA